MKSNDANLRGSLPKANSEKASTALYVYCIGLTTVLSKLVENSLPSSIEARASLELISTDEVAAVVSEVPLPEYNQESLARLLSDPSWTATRAVRHEVAVEHFARRATVIPLRFGTIYLRRESVERFLSDNAAKLRSRLAELDGKEEWGVNVYVDRVKIKQAVTLVSPRLVEMEKQAASSPPGQAYLLRKKIDDLRVEEARTQGKRIAREIEEKLEAASDGVVRLRTLKGESSEHGDVVSKLAILVRRESFAAFRATAESLADEHANSGVRLELTGPWPLYNFVNLNIENGGEH